MMTDFHFEVNYSSNHSNEYLRLLSSFAFRYLCVLHHFFTFSPACLLAHLYSIFPCTVFLWSIECKDEWKEKCLTGLCTRACFAQLVFVPPGSATDRLRFLPVAGLLSDSPCSTEGPVRPRSVSLRTRAVKTTPQQLNLSRGTSSKVCLKFH